MNITGIIAEYNPFHNGHLYQINKAHKEGADYIIIIMSGDFMQRGTPAIVDKYTRTRMALLNGADLVIELPVLFATGSAQYFARGAVSLLDKLNVVDTLCFGCETDNVTQLLRAVDFLFNESEEYKKELQVLLKQGISFPKAREKAMQSILGDETSFLLSSPNNILAIEYCLALRERNSKITPLPLKREGQGYHDLQLNNSEYPSATAIRRLLIRSISSPVLDQYIPSNIISILHERYHKTFPIVQNDFSALLKYKLLLESSNGLMNFADVPTSLSDKIIKNLNLYSNFDSFCQTLKSKDITYARINRCLTHILLHITEDTLSFYKSNDYAHYARILGFKSSSVPLLSNIKAHTEIPLISKMADAFNLISDEVYSQLEHDILASNIYESVVSERYQKPFQNEYTQKIVIIP